MNTIRIRLSRSIPARIYLLMALAVTGMAVGYFALPAGIIESSRTENEFSMRQAALQDALQELTRLALVTHLDAVRATGEGGPGNADSTGLVNELARSSSGAMENALKRAAAAATDRGARPLADRLGMKVRAFLDQGASAGALDSLLVSTDQLQRFSAQALEVRSEALARDAPAAKSWRTGLLAALLAGVGWVSVLTLRSTKASLRTLDQALKDRGEAVAQMQGERDFAARLIGTAPAAIVELDGQGRVRFVSRFFEESTGWSLEEIKGREWFTFALPPEIRERSRSAFLRGLVETPLRGRLGPILTRSGEERIFEWNSDAQHDSGGRIEGILCIGVDVTERRRMQEEVLVGEERLRLALQSAGQGLYDLDLATGNCTVSPEYALMIGHDPATFVETNAAWAERLHPDDREKVYGLFEAYVRGEIPAYEVEFRQRTREGGWLWTLSIGSIVARDAQGKPLRMLGTHTNIDARRRAEEALRVSEDRLAQAIRCSQIGIFDHDHLTDEVYWSPEMRELHGAPLDGPVQIADYLAALHPEDRGPIEQAVRQAHDPAGDGLYDVEPRVIRKSDGAVRWMLTRSQTFFEGAGAARRPVRTVGAVADVTDRRQQEQALRESEARYRRAERGTNDGLWEWDTRTGGEYFSPRWLEILGYSKGDLPTTVEAFADLIHPDDREAVWAAAGDHLQEGRVFDVEMRMRCKDGAYKWVRSRGEAERGADGAPGRMTGFITDISERKRAAQALEASRHHLQRVLDSMYVFVAVMSRDGLVEDMNRAPLDAGGFTLDDLLGRPFADLAFFSAQPASRAWLQASLQRALQGETSRTDLAADIRGEIRYFDAVFGPLRDDDGNITSTITSGVDVTDRRRADEALRASESSLKRAQALVRLGHFSFEADGNDPELSDAVKEMWGFTPRDNPLFSELIPRIHPEDREGVLRTFEKAREKAEVFEQEYRIVRPDQTEVTVRSVREPFIDDSGHVRYFGAMLDITSQKKVESALRESEGRLKRAQRSARIGNWDLDLASSRLRWSDEIFNIFEIDRSKFEASYEGFLNAIHPEDREMVNAAYTTSLDKRQPYRITHRLLMADGRIKHVEEQCESDFAADGTPLNSHGTIQDVTERVLAEQAVRRSLHEKETLLREIHHRVKNNLQIISSLLYFQAKKARSPRSMALFEEARQRLRSMILVHEKLYNSRDLAEVDFADYVRSLADQMGGSIGGAARRVRFKVEAAEISLPIESAVPCGMILVELMTNVLKYARKGKRIGDAFVRVEKDHHRVRLMVSDSGPGFPTDFDPRTSDSFGWQLVRNLVEQLDGDWTIERGPGAPVTVSFPRPQPFPTGAMPGPA